MNKKLCHVTADNDPSGEWMEIEATSAFHAGAIYWEAEMPVGLLPRHFRLGDLINNLRQTIGHRRRSSCPSPLFPNRP